MLVPWTEVLKSLRSLLVSLLGTLTTGCFRRGANKACAGIYDVVGVWQRLVSVVRMHVVTHVGGVAESGRDATPEQVGGVEQSTA